MWWLLALLLLPHPAQAYTFGDSYYDWTDDITAYDVDIVIAPNGQVDITESITYDFGRPGHGIFRSLPQRYVSGLLNDNIDVELISVTDAAGNPWDVATVAPSEFSEPNGNVVWRIGNPDVEVDDEQQYTIHYTVDDVMLYFDDYTEFYWNAIGNYWTVPIAPSTITIQVPPNSLAPAYEPQCYTGPYAAAAQDCTITWDHQTITVNLQALPAYNGATVDLAFVPGAIAQPNFAEVIFDLVKDNWSLGLLPGIALLLVVLVLADRPAKSKRPLIPIYEAPQGMLPHTAEFMVQGRNSAKSFAATLVELARTGFIHFIYDEDKKAVTKLRRMNTDTPTNDAVATTLLQSLFGTKTEIVLKSTIVNQTYFLGQFKKQNVEWARAKGWFDRRRETFHTIGVTAATLLGIASGFMIVQGFDRYLYHWGWTGIGTLICIIGYVIAQRKYRAFSVLGADVANEVEGFKWFLRVTEQERLKFTSAPKLTPKLFEQFLPYAIALGVEEEWINQFKSILVDPPTWLEGPGHNLAVWTAFQSLHTVSHQFKAPAGSRTSSGFGGGGGFSGGGFGGGGGGRW